MGESLHFWTYLCITAIGIHVILCADPKAGVTFDPRCTKTFNKTGTEPEYTIKTPNFPEKYDNQIRCGWTIESPEEAADITIKFHYFDLESSKRCAKYDYVMLYKQGNGQQTWDQIGYLEGYCGKQDSFTVSATTKKGFIKFFADDTRAFAGFNATFEIHITQASPRILCLGREGDTTCNGTVRAEQRDVLTLSCRASAIPPATYEWEKVVNETHGITLRDGLVKTKFPNGSIQLHNLDLPDAGSYRCRATNKHGSTEQPVALNVAQKCLCKRDIRVSWFPKPPYTKYRRGVTKGIFYSILDDMVQAVCGNCEKGHGRSVVQWYDSVNNQPSRGLSDVKDEIEDGRADVYLPILGLKTDDRYRNVYYFLPIVDSPGVALMIIGSEDGAAAMAIFDSIVQGWPILVLTIVMAALAGIIMWMLDTYWNEEQFPRTFSEGIVEGFWWAFITMTTVGYGDIAPVGVPGRLFAVIWILTGLVIIAIFTGVITTSLTVTALSGNVKLYGTVIGALNNSAEYRMGVVKNAEMKSYLTYDAMKVAMDKREVEGTLLDSYVAAYHKNLFGEFRVNNIFKSSKAFGLVLGEDLSKDDIPKKFANYLEENKAIITKKIEENVDSLPEPKDSAAEEASGDLFDPTSTLFVKSMIASSIILSVLTVGGLMFEYGYLRPRHRMIEAAKNLEMVESVEVKEMARRSKLLKETLLEEVQKFYDHWEEKFSNLTKKHKAEQKKILSKGSSSGPPPINNSDGCVNEAVEFDGTDTVDKPSSAGEFSRSNGSNTSLVK